MAKIIDKLIKKEEIVYVVNYNYELKGKIDKNLGIVNGELEKKLVKEFFKDYSMEKVLDALKLVKLKKELLDVLSNGLTIVEKMKVQLALIILKYADVIIIKDFFSNLVFGEQQYFMWLLRNLVHKQKKSVLIIDNNMNFICEYSKRVYLILEKDKYKEIDNFYDDELYKYVQMPRTVALIKFLEKKGHQVDHEITFNETLKALYRSVT